MVTPSIRKLYYNFADTTWHDLHTLRTRNIRQNNLIIPCDKIGQTGDIIERFYMVPKTRGGGNI